MSTPFSTPPPGIQTGVSEISASLHNASEPSQWVSGTLRDSFLYREFISQIEKLRETIWTAFEALISVLEAIIALFEAVKMILQLLDDLVAAAIKAIIQTLQSLKDLLIQFLSDMLGMGFYLFPHFMHYDWARVISDTLLNPYGVSYGNSGVAPMRPINTIAPTLRAFPDPTRPGSFTYRMISRPGKRGMGIDQFLDDLKKSFDNTNDRLRPLFSSAVGCSGAVILLGFQDVFAFARIVIFLMDTINPKGNYGARMAMYIKEITAKTLGQANDRGTGSPEALESAQKFLDDCASDDIVKSLYSGVNPNAAATNTATDKITITFPDVSDTDQKTTGNLAVFGHLGNNASLNATPTADSAPVFGALNTGSVDAFLGSYRANQVEYSVSQSVKNGPCRVYVQRLVGDKVCYQSPVKLDTNRDGCMAELNGISRGIAIQESKGAAQGRFYAPLDFGGSDDFVFEKSLLCGSLGSDKLFGVVDAQGVPKGSWYINIRTRVVRKFNGGSWYTAARPNVLMFTSWDTKTNTLVAGPILIYVIRFHLANETIKTTDTSVDPPINGYATYNYDDDYSTGGRCEVELSWSKKAKAAALMGIPQSKFDQQAGLPKVAGGGGGALDMSMFSWDEIMVDTTKLPCDITTTFNAPGSASDGSWYILENHKRVARMTQNVFTGMEITGGLDRISFKNGRTVVKVAGEKIDRGVTAIELVAEAVKETLPVGPGGGQNLYAITATSYSRPITYQVIREDPLATGGIQILSSKTVTPRTVDATFRNQLSALGSSFVKGWKDLTSGDEWKKFFDNPNNQFIGKYYWRGIKGGWAGVLIYNKDNPSTESLVFEPDAKTMFAATNPMLLGKGVHNFRVYSFGESVYASLPEGYDKSYQGVWDYLVDKNDPAKLKGLSEPLDWTVTVDDKLDTRDIPGKHAWQNVSLKRWFDVVEPLDQFLQSLIDSIPIPPSVFQWLIDWIDRIERRIKYWEQILIDIQDWIDKLLRIFDIGDTGFYFLGINGAAGSAGFIKRITDVSVPDELKNLPYATGLCMLLPDDIGGTQLMSLLFDWLPQQRLPDEPAPGAYPNPGDIIAEAYKSVVDQGKATMVAASAISTATTATFMNDMKTISVGIKNMSQRDSQKIVPEGVK